VSEILDEVPPPAMPVHLTPGELALRWKITTRTLERWRAEPYGPAWTHLGGSVRYRLADVLAFEARFRRDPNPRGRA
jgi:hypothetical protein